MMAEMLLPKKYIWYPNTQIESPQRRESITPAPKKISFFQRRSSAVGTAMMKALQASAIKPVLMQQSPTPVALHKFRTSGIKIPIQSAEYSSNINQFMAKERRKTNVAELSFKLINTSAKIKH